MVSEKSFCKKLCIFALSLTIPQRLQGAAANDNSRTMDKKTLTLIIAVIIFLVPAAAQKRRAPVPPRRPQMLQYEIIGGDTVYMDVLNPSRISLYGHRRGKDWRKYYRLVWNFSKTYPYALVARKLIHDTDSTFAKDELGRRQRDKYVNAVQKELFNAFEDPMRHMTITQGQLLMKLIDREVGKSSYFIIKDYKSGLAAGFWQGIAKIFGSDLKKHYDSDGEDRQVEELVHKWDNGEFQALYFSIFGEYPKRIEIPSKYM